MKKNVFIVAMLCSTLAVNAQTEINSAKKIRVGFNLGTNYSILRSKESLPTNSKIYNDFGYKIGVLMDYSISRQLFFTPKAELAFNNSGIESTNNDNTMSKYKIFPASID
ncbi:MAG TPA: hypothetical protein EYN89_13340, partial [Flavobacteriales bacterium]|nr:hypothetical protein [Flavobacteriales bacterium]